MSKIISFDIENSFGENSVCFGIDEAGRGCLAGPVVAACCWINRKAFPKNLLSLINDSKKISEAKREDIFSQLSALPSDVFMYEWCDVSAEVIDEINILQASLLAMKNAYFKLMEKISFNPDIILVDGNKAPSISPCQCVIGGDALSYSIAAASIIAKVNKDRLLNKIGEEFPCYEFFKNKGYGTKAHLEALEKFGICPYHRKTYAPVKKFIK
ncbi:ribonuclease HII [bacterium]|nr:ribonuclease HII [bacterium]